MYVCECIHHYTVAAQAELADEVTALLRDYGNLPKVQNTQLDMIYALFGSRVSAPAVLRGLRLLGGLLREEAPPTDLWQRLNREIEDIVVRHGEAPKVWPRQYGYWYFALTAIEAIVRHHVAGGEDISELLALADTLFREKYAEGRKYYDLFPEMIAATRLIYQIPVLAHRGKQALSWLATARRVLLSLPGGYGKTQFELLCENVSQLHPDEAVRNLVNTLYMGSHSPDDDE